MPGVPPDAVENVKKLLKGMFRRGKNKKQQDDAQDNATSTQTPAPTTTSPAQPIPPTQPLVTGQHDQPQEAIPINHDAQPGPPGSAAGAKTAEGSESKPFATLDPAAGASKATVPTVDRGVDTAVTNTDEAVSAPAPADTTAGVKEDVLPATTIPSTTTTTTTPAQTSEVAEIKEAQQPSTVAATDAPTLKTDEVSLQPSATAAVTANAPGAPGMSATSGPLEDYPEVGDAEHKK